MGMDYGCSDSDNEEGAKGRKAGVGRHFGWCTQGRGGSPSGGMAVAKVVCATQVVPALASSGEEGQGNPAAGDRAGAGEAGARPERGLV